MSKLQFQAIFLVLKAIFYLLYTFARKSDLSLYDLDNAYKLMNNADEAYHIEKFSEA